MKKIIQDIQISLSGLFILILVVSCHGDKIIVPDTSDIQIKANLIPFHKEMLPNNRDATKSHIKSLSIRYPHFSQLFFNVIFPIFIEDQIDPADLLFDHGFVNLIDTCKLVFEEIDIIESDLTQAFKYYNYYTTDKNIPNVYTFVSGFAYQTFVFEDGPNDGLGIGLDMFLGADFPYKRIDPNNPGFSEYLTYFFDRKYLIRKTLFTWLDDKIPFAKTSDLMDIIIRNGKILYILEKILPKSPKDVVLEFRPDEYEWCTKNEVALWSHLLKENLLYESNFSKINKLVNPSPGASGIPQEAPGGVANYIGWRIIHSYMDRSEVTINQLIAEENSQRIMDLSRFKPINH